MVENILGIFGRQIFVICEQNRLRFCEQITKICRPKSPKIFETIFICQQYDFELRNEFLWGENSVANQQVPLLDFWSNCSLFSFGVACYIAEACTAGLGWPKSDCREELLRALAQLIKTFSSCLARTAALNYSVLRAFSQCTSFVQSVEEIWSE